MAKIRRCEEQNVMKELQRMKNQLEQQTRMKSIKENRQKVLRDNQ